MIGLVLVTLRDLIVGYNFATLLAALIVADWTKVVAVQLVELNLLARLNRVVNANGNRDQQKANMTFPDRSHMDPLLNRGLCHGLHTSSPIILSAAGHCAWPPRFASVA